MRITNFLLSIIALLLFFHLFKQSDVNLINKASAQTSRANSSNKDTMLVKIVDIGTVSGALPVIYGSSHTGYILPVGYGTKSLPVVISQPR